jgi:hypothetical protein
MHRAYGWAPGEEEVFNAELDNALRQAQAFGLAAGGMSIADTARLRDQKRRRGRGNG